MIDLDNLSKTYKYFMTLDEYFDVEDMKPNLMGTYIIGNFLEQDEEFLFLFLSNKWSMARQI